MNIQEQICWELKLDNVDQAWVSSLKIINTQVETIGFLVPVGSWILNDSQTVESIRHWRQRAMKNYLVQFESSYQRTWNYLQQKALLERTRILFMVAGLDGSFIGHVGLCNINNESAELDNLMRGVSGGAKDLMLHAEKTIIQWAFLNLQIEEIFLRVLSFNFLAIDIHKSLGFEIFEQIPLRMETQNGDKILVPCDPGQTNVNYCSYIMVLREQKFSALLRKLNKE